MTCQGEGGDLCSVFSMHFFAQTQYTKQLAATKKEKEEAIANFKQNAFSMVTPPRRNNIQVPELTGASLGNSPVGVKYQHYPEQVQIFQTQINSPAGETREVQEPLINFKNVQQSPHNPNMYPQGITPPSKIKGCVFKSYAWIFEAENCKNLD